MFKKKTKKTVLSVQHEAVNKMAENTPKANEFVQKISAMEADLLLLKRKVCTHESRYKNGVEPVYTSFIVLTQAKEEFNECIHCGAKIKAEKWVEA